MSYQFVVTSTYYQALQHLDHQSQKIVGLSVQDFQKDLMLLSSSKSGDRLHPLKHTHTPNLFSISCNMDLRVILLRDSNTFVYLHVGHHDAAYQWAKNKKFKLDFQQGKVQMFTVQEKAPDPDVMQKPHTLPAEGPRPFEWIDDKTLQDLGIPEELWPFVRSLPESRLPEIIDHLSEDAADALIRIHSGEKLPDLKTLVGMPIKVADGQIEGALGSDFQTWMVFLHPAQERLARSTPSSSMRITGGPGTGKTVVALHWAAFLAREHPEKCVLLTCFSKTLAERLEQQLPFVVPRNDPAFKNIEVMNLHKVARELYKGSEKGTDSSLIYPLLAEVYHEHGSTFDFPFVLSEWQQVVEAQGLWTFEAYRGASRTGRGTPLGAMQRKHLWSLFERVLKKLEQQEKISHTHLLTRTARQIAETGKSVYDFVIADEAQDLGPAELEFIRALVKRGPSDITLVGDPQQRIFKAVGTWLSHCIDIRNNTSKLKVNYRTTRQIQQFAEQAMGMSGEITLSSLQGPEPRVVQCMGDQDQVETIAHFVRSLLKKGHHPSDVAILERNAHLAIASRVARELGLEVFDLKQQGNVPRNRLPAGSLHRAKGLEFRAVVIASAGKNHLPLPVAMKEAQDEADRNRIRDLERQLLYVGITRAREQLLITHTGQVSPFLSFAVAP
ncbi:3'-5' exonuclease [Deinococcus roseus]|uniref:DNA 3'-5' helicase n=1 Tax=Deinococcus roseus TaxID=392414 RepID=A0ABQ2DEJ4_9DEIO|nr:3'-5' exonuclease [Deinococcus roseus]GGJ55345.1 DNA helicase [Deinococcus roseus]